MSADDQCELHGPIPGAVCNSMCGPQLNASIRGQLPRRSLVYISGAPGAGKSTLMAHLTRHCPRETLLKPFAHDLLTLPAGGLPVFSGHAVELGRRREKFSGTDALSMSVIGAAEEYLARPGQAHPLILAEGDRLANVRFLTTATRLGWDVRMLHLEAPEEVLDARCAARGSAQNEQWRRGRITKARNLITILAASGDRVTILDSRNSVECLAAAAVAAVPVLAALLPSDAPERAQ